MVLYGISCHYLRVPKEIDLANLLVARSIETSVGFLDLSRIGASPRLSADLRLQFDKLEEH